VLNKYISLSNFCNSDIWSLKDIICRKKPKPLLFFAAYLQSSLIVPLRIVVFYFGFFVSLVLLDIRTCILSFSIIFVVFAGKYRGSVFSVD
jgi:hypothetical protein